MKQKLIVVLALLMLVVVACGANPVEKLEEAAAEQIAETIIEQTTGIDDIEVDTEDGSVSYSVEDEDGNTISIDSSTEEGRIDAIEGMGFNIALPDGLVDGTLQQIDENGEPIMITGIFSIVDLTSEQFVEGMHTALTNEGFTYTDLSESGREMPDPTDPMSMISFAYEHPDGYMFTILWGEEDAILGLMDTNIDEESAEVEADAGEETAVSPADVIFDGSMNVDKTKYAANEPIQVTLVINTPLADDAWVGIVPSDTPHGLEADSDAAYITYVYVRDAQDGIIMLEAPYDAGNYDVRIFDTDSNGVELDSIFIIVE